MALNDDALFTAAKGHIYVAPVGTAAPTPAEIAAFTSAAGMTTPWVDLGHTSREDLPEPGFDGGDTETRGTWQNAAVKEVITDVTVDYLTFNLHQFDDTALALYYGQDNAAGAVDGEFQVADSATATQLRAFLMVVVDGDANIAFYARKASIRREGPIALGVDEFSTLPMRATFVKDGSNDLFRWISTDMGINPA